MIRRAKDFAKRHWPRLRLRAIVFSVLFFAAAMPGIGAIFLRVYENTLVRQTEAELVAQGATLAAVAAVEWPGGPPAAVQGVEQHWYRPEPTTIDLRASPVLPERPFPTRSAKPADPSAVKMGEALQPVADLTARTTLASILLLDRDGVVALGAGAGGSLAMLPEVQAALAGAPQTVLRANGDYRPTYPLEWLSRASNIRLHHARPVVVDGRIVAVVLLSRSPRALFRGLYEDRGKILLGIGVTFGVLVVLAGLVSRGVTRPIEALSAASREVASGRGSVPDTPRTAAIEIQALYEDFRQMSHAIERRSAYLRDFAAAISHEFKTPLAGMGGAIELLQDHGDSMSPEERRRFLDNLATDVARLSRLVSRLLDMARADMARPEVGVATALPPLLRQVGDSHRRPGFKVALTIPQDLPAVAAPEAALEAVLSILLQNSRQAGASQVAIVARELADAVVLRVGDNGPGIAAGDQARLFEPFFTTRRSQGGTGLGLPIARSLLAAHGATIDLEQAEPAVFVLRLVRA